MEAFAMVVSCVTKIFRELINVNIEIIQLDIYICSQLMKALNHIVDYFGIAGYKVAQTE